MRKRVSEAGFIAWLVFFLGLGGYGAEEVPLEESATEAAIVEPETEMVTAVKAENAKEAAEMTTMETVVEEDEIQPEEFEEAGVQVWSIIGGEMDFVKLREAGHAILVEDICQTPSSIYDNPWLLEQLTARMDEWEIDSGEMIDYFTFDLNDDGEDEYIVSIDGPGWNGSAGNWVRIWRKDEDGNLEPFFATISRLHIRDSEYAPLAVLEETSGGYHSIVFPESYNHIWFYDEESDTYDTVDFIDYDRCRACLKEQIPELDVWAKHVERESGGEAQLDVEIYFKFSHEYVDNVYLGSYYPVYVRQGKDTTYFEVSMEYDEVLWRGPVDAHGRMLHGRVYALDEWRASSEYPDLGGKIHQ